MTEDALYPHSLTPTYQRREYLDVVGSTIGLMEQRVRTLRRALEDQSADESEIIQERRVWEKRIAIMTQILWSIELGEYRGPTNEKYERLWCNSLGKFVCIPIDASFGDTE